MDKESSEWQLQGQPTVLLTLAHIFHRFAPLLVREGRRQAPETCLRRGLGCRGPKRQSPQTARVPPSKGGDTAR